MLKTTLELRVKELHKRAKEHIKTLDINTKNIVNEIIQKSNNLVTFSVFEISNEIFDNFVSSLESQIPRIEGQFDQIMDLYDSASSVFHTAESVVTGLSVGVQNFNTLYNFVINQTINNITQNVIQWPSEWQLVPNNFVDPEMRASMDGWKCYKSLNICEQRDRFGKLIDVKSYDEIVRQYTQQG